jgi:hypothetical protein
MDQGGYHSSQPLVSGALDGKFMEEPAWKTDTAYDGTTPMQVKPTAHRRYSSEWWSYRWDREVVKGFLPRFIYIVAGFTIMGIWIGIIFLFANRQTHQQRQNAIHDVSIMQNADSLVPSIVSTEQYILYFNLTIYGPADHASRGTASVQYGGSLFNRAMVCSIIER